MVYAHVPIRVLQDAFGNLITSSVPIEVRRENTGTLARLYSDRDGTTQLPNPFTPVGGKIKAYTSGGAYRFHPVGYDPADDLRYVGVGTAQEQDANTYNSQGWQFQVETETSAPPTAGCVRFNALDLSAVTEIYVSSESLNGSNAESNVLGLDPGSKTVKNRVAFADQGSGVVMSYAVDSATDSGDYVTLAVSDHEGSTSYSGAALFLQREMSGRNGFDQDDARNFETVTEAAASDPVSAPAFMRTAGYAAAGDGGGALYKYVASEPSHDGKIEDADGNWFELAEREVSVLMFGAAADGDGVGAGTNLYTALQAAIDMKYAAGGGVVSIPEIDTGIYKLGGAITMKSGVEVRVAKGVKIDCTGLTGNLIQFLGTAGSEINTSGDLTRGDTAVTTASAHGLATSDYVQIIGQRNALSSDAGDWRVGDGTVSLNYAYFGEWLQVAAVGSSTTFTSAVPLIFPDYRDDITLETDTDRTRTTIRKITPCLDAHWVGGEFINATDDEAPILGKYAVDCTLKGVVVRRGSSQGGSVHWDQSLRCYAEDVRNYNDPTLTWDYTTLHGKLNRYRTVSSQDCGFVRCYDEYGAQSFDFTYGGSATPYLVNVRSYAERCVTRRSFEAVTSHPGCFQERWDSNRWLECYRGGIIVRGLQATVVDNVMTSSRELIATLSDGSNASPCGITLQDGHAKGAHIHGNKISGFRYAFRVVDGGDVESRFTNVDALIENNTVTDCYAALGTTFSIAGTSNARRRISYIGNHHRRIQRYVIELGRYSAGNNFRNNVLDGHFLNEAADTDVAFLAAMSGDCPAQTFMGNQWFRDVGTNSGITVRLVNIGNITDTTTFPSGTWQKLTRVRDNIIGASFSTIISVTSTAYNQVEEFSDANDGVVNGLLSGSYTPTLTNNTNIAASTAHTSYYFRVGDMVHVFGTVEIDATTASSQISMSMSLPIASNLGSSDDLAGVFGTSAASQAGRVTGSAGNDNASFVCVPDSSANLTYNFSFSYKVI